ncbi:lytic transglycosylase domain-containing protein [Pedobacter sp. SYP-B3415]|uniref:lytic transglycosylase domain-containing protein n=1 Tax=Pedobacter sp. SYP-B3415 TaxID=2496641 RepID=UPI00101D8201|nr:lytic transglycosylase domain-containing protein [Pedobacter sp. SYP-B3415]
MQKKLLLSFFSALFLTGFSGVIPSYAQQFLRKDSIKPVSGLTPSVFLPSNADTTAVPEVAETPFAFGSNYIYKLRLDSIQKLIPLTYNEYVQKYIDIYSQRKDMMGRMLGLSEYYFPIFERALKDMNMPNELKYLPIIESSMNPHAVSRVGATGLWQFMFATAKAYGLGIDTYIDERKDPISASYAAAAYFRDSYEELGDWLLAIAAYNCGKGNVDRAIRRAGSRDFWEIRPFLPRETRNYVPAFIAAVYVMNYAPKHQISAHKNPMQYKTDTMLVNRMVSLTALARAMDFDEDALWALNPSYRKKLVNGSADNPKRIILPKLAQYNYAKVYDAINADESVLKPQIRLVRNEPVIRAARVSEPQGELQLHKVKSGQNLGIIAEQYGVEVQDLKAWNHLPGNTIVPAQTLKIYAAKKVSKQQTPAPRFVTYKVKTGDTLSGIAEKFEGITVYEIKKANGLKKSALQPGMVLKIQKG